MYDCVIISAAAFEAEYGFVGFKTPISSENGISVTDSQYTSSVLKCINSIPGLSSRNLSSKTCVP